MAKEVAVPATQIDPWSTDKSTWEYISIPAKELTGRSHPKMSINRHEFFAGKKYHVPPQIARELESMLERHAKQTRRVLSNDIDLEALIAVANNGVSAGTVGEHIDVNG
jgi:hypothetical protein